jgi:Raf kinase inhibitor-like YbhB/YbcL family protein
MAVAGFVVAAVSCGGDDPTPPTPSISPIPADLDQFSLTSPAFEEGAAIPVEFTCDGDGVSPPLQWSGIPQGSVELILTLLDPDAPDGVFTHWTVYGISPSSGGFPQGSVSTGGLEGRNDFGDEGYGPPCPPAGEPHRYIFTLGALTETSGLQPGAEPSAVDRVLLGASATTTLTGQYPA